MPLLNVYYTGSTTRTADQSDDRPSGRHDACDETSKAQAGRFPKRTRPAAGALIDDFEEAKTPGRHSSTKGIRH